MDADAAGEPQTTKDAKSAKKEEKITTEGTEHSQIIESI